MVSEVLRPGSVTLAYVYKRLNNRGGFVEYYDDQTYTPLYRDLSRIACALGGIAANEWKFGVTDIGGGRDLDNAFSEMKDLVINRGICGLHLYSYGYRDANSQNLRAEQEQATAKEIEKIYRKVKEILSLNAEFLEKLADALSRKKLLSAADVQKIQSECKIVPVAL